MGRLYVRLIFLCALLCALCACGLLTRPFTPACALAQSPDDEAALALEMDRRSVSEANFAQAVLYSWTTTEQIEDLRKHMTLLTADAGTGGIKSPFHLSLERLVTKALPGHEAARLLIEHADLRKRRYAWPTPLATAIPRGGRSYGTALIRMELKPEAWIGRMEPNSEGEALRFVTLRGEAVPMADVLADPTRIGAVYHVAHGARTNDAPFREFIVCNPHMLARWEVGTDAVKATIDADIALVEGLLKGPIRKALRGGEREPAAIWLDTPSATWTERWWAMLTFDIPRYQPVPKSLREILAELRLYDQTPPPIVWDAATE